MRAFPWSVPLAAVLLLLASDPRAQDAGWSWVDADALTVEGRPFADRKATWDRLPGDAEGVVRDPVWRLSRDSAGMAVGFATDAPAVRVRWDLTRDRLALPHMPATGVSGVDLYVRTGSGGASESESEDGDDGAGAAARWRWLGCTKPTARQGEGALVTDLEPRMREYRAYLPLYNGVRSLAFGVPEGASLRPGRPATPAETGQRDGPIVFYGTSITQGACASRPGMTHVALLGRRLGRETVNLGFSGQGRLDLELAPLLGRIDAAAYVIDCLPNVGARQIRARLVPFVEALRAARPGVPILLVEDRTYANAFLRTSARQRHRTSRAALRDGYRQLLAKGVVGLSYLEGDALLGDDGDATVDGSHPTDLGFVRQADAFEPRLRALLTEAGEAEGGPR